MERRELIELLAEHAAAHALPRAALERAADYALELERWSARVNLTADRDARRIALRHVLDSWAALPLLPDTGTLADLGSGGGLPGIPLAIARPDLSVTLIESRGKKVAFLEHVAHMLKLDNVRVLNARIEDVEQRFDLACGRALAAPPQALTLLRSLLEPQGLALLWTTAADAQTIDRTTWRMERSLSYSLVEDAQRARLILLLGCY